MATIKSNEPFNEFIQGVIAALTPYAEMQKRIKEALVPFAEFQGRIKETIKPFAEIVKAFEPVIARIQEIEQQHGSLTNYLTKAIEERHQVLYMYGWFYAFGMPDQLADEVFENQATLKQDDVDRMVTGFFSDEDYSELSSIVSSWNHSPFFLSRQHIFDEALANHMQRRYYSSVTVLSLHTEGVVRDYLRTEAKARYRFEQCINDLEQLLIDQSGKVYFHNVERTVLFSFLIDVCNSDFWHEDPEWQDPAKTNRVLIASHNLSRNKIAHGHAISGLSEADSLKCFLYLNALFQLFLELEQGGKDDGQAEIT